MINWINGFDAGNKKEKYSPYIKIWYLNFI